MMEIWENYKSTLLLLIGVTLGGMIGWLWPGTVVVLGPIGRIFMNLLFVLIVPMVFFSVSSSICNLSSRSALGKTLGATFGLMLGLMLLMAFLTYMAMLAFPPVERALLAEDLGETGTSASVGDLIVDAFTVSDFAMLFSVKHILPLMVVAILMGWAVARLKNLRIARALEIGNSIVMQMMDCVMIVAPLGLGCYFAEMMASSADMLASGFGRLLLLYIVVAGLVYVIVYPAIVWVSRGKGGIGIYWKNVLHPSLMAISTLSSSACLPANIQAAKQMGAEDALAESVVPIGTQLHKEGSVISAVTKVMFVMLLSGRAVDTPEALFVILGVSLLASMVVGAVPTGAGTAELFICSILGVDPQMVGLLIVISTLVDMPGTLLNVTGNTILPVVVAKIVKK